MGRLTRTLPAGTPDLRRADVVDLVGTPFDEFFYTPDVRRTEPYGISKLIFHLYRGAGAVKVRDVDPLPHAAPPARPTPLTPVVATCRSLRRARARNGGMPGRARGI